jgi:hypothetical protein
MLLREYVTLTPLLKKYDNVERLYILFKSIDLQIRNAKRERESK